MLDYYGDFSGPNIKEATLQIISNINAKKNNNSNYLKYISHNEITYIINYIVANNYNGVSSYSGWCTYTLNHLVKLSIIKLKEKNIENKKIFLFYLINIFENILDDDSIKKIISYL